MRRSRFLHLPKTAGSTMAAILQREYAGVPSFEFTGRHPEDLQRWKAMGGADSVAQPSVTAKRPRRQAVRSVDTSASG